MADLTGRVALITGASGIGLATATLLAAKGAAIFSVDRDPAQVSALRTQLPDARGMAGDVSHDETCDEAVRQVLAEFGQLDILVNVAGLSGRRFGDGPVHEATAAGWDTVMDNNARSTFLMCRAALHPMMAARSGSIVNTASVLAYAPASRHFATHGYAASKGAILGLTRSMASYYARFKIRVNAVVPGLIATPMSQRAQQDPDALEYIGLRQPLTGAPGAPEDVAEAALYLASDAARFVTGVSLEVAGGWSVSG